MNPESNEHKIQPLETAEKEPVTLEQELKRVLIQQRPVNEGSNALIYKLELEDVPEELRSSLETEQDRTAGPDTAVKLLKLYNKGKAKREYINQRRAYEILQDPSVSPTTHAMVPKPIEFRELDLDQETIKVLNTEGALLSERAEVLVMDYIDGVDIATVFYRWIVDHAPKDKEHIKQNIHPDSFEHLRSGVEEILEFIKPSQKGASEADRALEMHKAHNINAAKVYAYLKKTGFKLNPKVHAQISNTLQAFEKNMFFHNDDHERNFMVSGDYFGDGDVRTYVIDFDKAGPHTSGTSLSFRIDKQLAEFTADNRPKTDTSIIEKKLSNPEWVKKQEDYFQVRDPEILKKRLLMASLTSASAEASFDDFVALMVKLVENRQLESNDAKQLLNQVRDRMVVKTPRKQDRIINPNIYKKAGEYKELFS